MPAQGAHHLLRRPYGVCGHEETVGAQLPDRVMIDP